MNKNLEDYIKIYKFMPIETCQEIIGELQDANWKQHEYYIPSQNIFSSINGNRELDVTYMETAIQKPFLEGLKGVFRHYIKELEFPWFDSFVCCTSPRFNRYSVGRIMNEHCDHIHSIFPGEPKGVPILTALGALNEDYTGGEFVMFGDKEYKIKAGEIMVFPSSFLYPHKVNEVKTGTRYSFVSWAM